MRETDIGPMHSGTVAGIRWAFDGIGIVGRNLYWQVRIFPRRVSIFRPQEMLMGRCNDLPARRQCSCAPAQPAHEHVQLDLGSGHGQSFTRPVHAKSGKATVRC